jgi:DNA-binding CsgD family transcriptional regulator
LGRSLYRSGQFKAAQDPLSSASDLADEDGDGFSAMLADGIQAIIAAANGLAHDTERLATQSENTAANNALSQHFDAWCPAFARGWLALTQDEHERARGYFERALELLRRGPRILEVTEILTALSISEQALGSFDASARHLAEAQRILRHCPDPGYLLADPRKVSVKSESARTSERSPGWTSLTDAELLIARLVSEGLTNRAIASELFLSQHTVDSHLKHTFTKLDIRSRVQLTRVVLANGSRSQYPQRGSAGSPPSARKAPS